MLHIFYLTYTYCMNKLMTYELTLEITHLIFLFKNVTTWRQMLSVFCLIFKLFKISSKPFLVANTNQNEKKNALPSSVCHGLQENAFQVNQLFNVTWSSVGPWISWGFLLLMFAWIQIFAWILCCKRGLPCIKDNLLHKDGCTHNTK